MPERDLSSMSGEDDMATQPTAFGVLLKHFRVRAYLTQAKLAEHAGLSVDAIIKLEHGKRQAPRCETVLILGRALGLTAQDQHVLQDAARPPTRLCDLVVTAPPHIAALVQSLAELHARQAALIDLFVAADPAGNSDAGTRLPQQSLL